MSFPLTKHVFNSGRHFVNPDTIDLEATRLTTQWAVRPVGVAGTCGFYPRPWVVVYVSFDDAPTAEDAVRRVRARGGCFK